MSEYMTETDRRWSKIVIISYPNAPLKGTVGISP